MLDPRRSPLDRLAVFQRSRIGNGIRRTRLYFGAATAPPRRGAQLAEKAAKVGEFSTGCFLGPPPPEPPNANLPSGFRGQPMAWARLARGHGLHGREREANTGHPQAEPCCR